MAKRHRHDPDHDHDTSDIPSSPKFRPRSLSDSISDSDSDSRKSHSSTQTSKKYNRIDPKLTPLHKPVITCNFLPTCNRRPFSSYAEFESHYHQQHTNRCQECDRNFPSDRYLTIHIAENHDVFNELKREAGEKTYQCFVEGCQRLCSTPQKRRLHVIDKHGFPRDFFFRLVDFGIDHRESLLCSKQRRHSTGSSTHAVANTNVKNESSAGTPIASSLPEARRKSGPPGVDRDELQDKDEDTEKAGQEVVLSRELDMMDGGGDGNGGGDDGDRPGGIRFEGDDNGEFQKTPARSQKGKAERQKPARRRSERQSGKGRGTAVDTDKDMTDVTDMMAAVKLAPRQIRFGRGGSASVGFSTRR